MSDLINLPDVCCLCLGSADTSYKASRSHQEGGYGVDRSIFIPLCFKCKRKQIKKDIILYFIAVLIFSFIGFLLVTGKQEYQLSYSKMENSYLHEIRLKWVNKEDDTKKFTTALKGRILHEVKNKRIFKIELWDYRTEEQLPNSENKVVTHGKHCILKLKKKDLAEIILLTLTAGFMGWIFAYYMKNLFINPVRISKSGQFKFKNPEYQKLYDQII